MLGKGLSCLVQPLVELGISPQAPQWPWKLPLTGAIAVSSTTAYEMLWDPSSSVTTDPFRDVCFQIFSENVTLSHLLVK